MDPDSKDETLGKPVKMLVFTAPNGKVSKTPIRSEADVEPAIKKINDLH